MNIIDRYLKELSTLDDKKKIKEKMNVSAGVIIKKGPNGENLVLLIQRAADDHWPLHWEAPRGKCDSGPNEKLIPCLKREVKEETGLNVKPVGFIDKFSYIAKNGTRDTTQYNFLCKLVNPKQEVKLSHEHQDHKWVSSVGEIELFVLPEFKKTIVKVLNPVEQIVTYPEFDLADAKINEICCEIIRKNND
ncbi:NUDIX domain-containing protein [Candidatus Pacearchaeota archaeon]|nr:NUDIX domain-containing protein [Candidatus Pacearchaeota archaeon]